VRARLAKEEYATTWQEEEQGEPQTGCVARPEVDGAGKREAFERRAGRRITQNQRTKDDGSKERGSQERGSQGSGSQGSGPKASGQTQHQAERAEPKDVGTPPSRGRSASGERAVEIYRSHERSGAWW
jgi:hypothetical protein